MLALLILIGAVAMPGWKWLIATFRPELTRWVHAFITSTYLLLIPAVAAMLYVIRLLCNLQQGQVFIRQNVVLLRSLVWCCTVAFVICVGSTVYYPLFGFIAAACGLMALLLNAVKNCFGHAVEMQDELDLTV